VISVLTYDYNNPINHMDKYDYCYATGEYDDYDCYSCPHRVECSGAGDDNDDE
jgi:hypothetical protein